MSDMPKVCCPHCGIEISSIEFMIGGFSQGFKKMSVMRDGDRYIAEYFPSMFEPEQNQMIELTKEEYEQYVHKTYMTYINEWDEDYMDPTVLDGESWTIRIKYGEGCERDWHGCNAYPPLWKQFLKTLNGLDLPDVK